MDACCICLSSGSHSGLLINQNGWCSLLCSVPMKPAVFLQLFIVGADWRDEASCTVFMCVTLLQLPVTLKTLTSWLRTARADLSDAQCFQVGLTVHHLFMEWTVCLRKQHLHIHVRNAVGWSSDIISHRLCKLGLRWSKLLFLSAFRFCSWCLVNGKRWAHFPCQSVRRSHYIQFLSVMLKWCPWCEHQIRVKPLQKYDKGSPASLLLPWFISSHKSICHADTAEK